MNWHLYFGVMSDDLQLGAGRPTKRPRKHPLTDQFISLVGGGMKPYDAAMRLVGPLLPITAVPNQLFEWEIDGEVDQQIQAHITERIEAAQSVREATIERLVAIINQDVRQFFRQTGDPNNPKTELLPVTLWSKWMSGAVKKLKYTQKTDPFGNVTDTMNLEFHDPMNAMKELRILAPEVYDRIKLDPKDGAIDVTVFEQLSDDELDALHSKLLKAV